MSLQFTPAEQPLLTLDELQALADGDAGFKPVLDAARQALGSRWFGAMELVREDMAGQHFGRDFELWHEDELIYAEGKQFLDAQQDYIDWLLPRCLTVQLAGTPYLLNYNIHTPEDWFYRANPAGFEHPNLS